MSDREVTRILVRIGRIEASLRAVRGWVQAGRMREAQRAVGDVQGCIERVDKLIRKRVSSAPKIGG